MEIPKIGRKERKKQKKKKRERERVREDKRKANNSNVGTNAGRSAKTHKEPVLACNLSETKELLRTQF